MLTEPAFAQIYDRYQRKVFRFFLKRILNHETARELTQEVFVKLWKNGEGQIVPSDGISIETRLFTIAGSILIDHLRRRAHERKRLSGLVHKMNSDPSLANTSPQFGPRSNWETRIKAVSGGGMAAIVDAVMGRFFSPETLAKDADAKSVKSVFLATNPLGYLGCCAAIRDFDSRGSLRDIRVPTLVIVGDRDVSTPWEGNGEVLASDIPGARVVRLPATHISNIECPRPFTMALLEFLR